VFASQLSEAQSQAIRAEAVTAEVRAQAQKADAELNTLRQELDAVRRARVEAETRLVEATRSFDEQKKLLEEARNKLTDAFRALSGDALKSNNQAFLELAKKSLEAILADAKGNLGKHQEAIKGLVNPLEEALKRYEQQVKALEESRQKAYGSLETQLQLLTSTQQQLQKETGNLVTALRTPQVRGRWGEVTLRRVVELAGMSDHCDYEEQVSVESDGGRMRPDMVVHLPADRDIVVDAKVSLAAYLEALSAESEEQRTACLQRHAQQLRTHMNQLAGKAYWEQFDRAPEMVVMFIPGESFFAAAVDCDKSLIEDGMSRRVVLATPTTLLALLRAVAYGWRQEQIAQNAQEISDLGRQLYERLRTLVEHFANVGKSLQKANEAYNRAVGSMETRVFAAARRFKDLGAASGPEIEVIEPIDATPRELRLPEGHETGP
ncbi:MAG TPA: DNA recombination protein RmuC, partial [Phycisphaerae bacterium]|nr:DNA recombination protein RmuC [Phycisphaerae bacterium]